MKLKLSILTASDFPYGMAMESFVRQLSLGLYENNVELEVVRLYGNRLDNKNDTSVKCSNFLFQKPLKNEFLKFFEVLCHVIYVPFFVFYRKVLKRDYAIIMYGLDRAYLVFPLTLFAKLCGVKTFRVNTEIYPEHTYASNWWRKPLIFFNKLQIKYFDRYLDGMIVLSHYLKKIEVENGVKEDSIILIPHFINVHNKIKDSKCLENNNIDRIGYCGDPSIENGILDLIDAFVILQHKRLNGVELIIIGKITSRIEHEIAKREIKNVTFTGQITAAQVTLELQKCSILVNPRRLGISADSGFPTKIGEYFAANKPVVATKVGDLNLYFKDKEELIFAEPNNPDSICNAIEYILDNREMAMKIAKIGNQWAIDNLDYKNNSRKLIDFMLKS